MLRQYQELKRQHPGALLFFRLGDFYELFFEDAITGARELEITLTARHKERGQPVPMCGVPHHAVANYVARLIRKGYRVAICEQTEDPSKAKKLVRREVVRVVTRYQLLYEDWRGYLVGGFALVWVANQYMSLYNRLRLDIKSEKIETTIKEKVAERVKGLEP